MDRKRSQIFASILLKSNKVLYVVLLVFCIFGFRLWYLTVVRHTSKTIEATRARRKVVVEPAMRGTIRDRFNVVLAANAIEYRVGIMWSPIQEIPRWISEANGRRYVRKEYVRALSTMLGKSLELDARRIEESVYAYAVFSPTTPVILHTGLSEKQYYALNMLAKDWPGLVVERSVKRVYPRKRLASHLVGYTAALNREELDAALSEMRSLRKYVERVETGEDLPGGSDAFFAAKKRLLALERRAYGFNDEIGKTGIEAAFEDQLRGMKGRRCFVTNAQGEVLRETVGSREPIPGKRIVLSLSAELQEWCEKLLCENESDRYNILSQDEERIEKGAKNPLIRGGAIIALEPKSGEVISYASFPRFDPNDFVRSGTTALLRSAPQERIYKWLENDHYLKRVWDMQQPLELEEVGKRGDFCDRSIWMTWDHYVESVAPTKSPILSYFRLSPTIGDLCELQNKLSTICEKKKCSYQDGLKELEKAASKAVSCLLSQCSILREQLFVLDLSRLLVRFEEFSPVLNRIVQKMSVDLYRSLICAKEAFSEILKRELAKEFEQNPFEEWKKEHKKKFLAEKRKAEEKARIPARPFLYYTDRELRGQFSLWWEQNKEEVLYCAILGKKQRCSGWVQKGIARSILIQQEQRETLSLLSTLLKKVVSEKEAFKLLAALKGFDGLTHTLWGTYNCSYRGGVPKTGQGLIRSYFSLRCSPLSSFCHTHASAPGSIFKLVVAHAALRQQAKKFREKRLDPDFFKISDRPFHQGDKFFVATDGFGRPIPRLYKGGRMPKSMGTVGEINMVSAIGRSSNPYFSLLAGDFLDNPNRLLESARALGYGQRTGICLSGEASGKLPEDLETNRTGLYTSAIGQHTLLATPLQSALMISTLANCGEMVTPRFVKMAIGPEVSFSRQLGPGIHQKTMRAVGIETPIWVGICSDAYKQHIHVPTRKVKREVEVSLDEQKILFEGMKESAQRALSGQMRNLYSHRPYLFRSFSKMKPLMIGKSSTAESLERLGVAIGQEPFMYNHTWFGSIFYPDSGQEPFYCREPELVVLVFLRYGRLGRDASLLAASVSQEWRKIQRKHA